MRRLAEVAGLGLALISASPSSHAQTAGIRADQGSVAIAGNVSGLTITIGIPQEKVDELVKERTKPLEELTAAQRDSIGLLREKLDLNERQVRAALDILGEANVSPERLAAKLVEVAEQFKALKATAAAEPGDDSSTTALKADAQKAIDAGDLAKADGLLAQAETAQKKARDRLVLNLAETSAKRGEIALTRLHYGEAAQHFADAAATFAADSAYEDKRAAYLERQADALYQQGYEFGDDGALRSAIELQKRLVELFPRARKPVDWTRIQHNLGLQLYTLGARESGTAMLEESVAAYREVLTELSPERTPLDWASAENNLGNSLLAIGEKQTAGTKLDEAIAAYREALKARPRQRVPLDWAATETGLGNGLYAIGIRGSGTAGLEEAVAAYRAALQESTRDRAPLIWATLQNNLGNALTRDTAEGHWQARGRGNCLSGSPERASTRTLSDRLGYHAVQSRRHAYEVRGGSHRNRLAQAGRHCLSCGSGRAHAAARRALLGQGTNQFRQHAVPDREGRSGNRHA
jgi:tetratricopeptide (TPR) repeat protein